MEGRATLFLTVGLPGSGTTTPARAVEAVLARWAGAFDVPPAGFASWDDSRRHRWPPSVP